MKVKFGNVVNDIKINIDRKNNPYEYYIAGDHLDSEELHISRRGKFATDDVGSAFTRLFKPGQVLYGSRRTYLKKIAVAHFEGICANTTFVLESKDNNIFDQKLLPFLMLSDNFTQYSILHSKGSTNPYILFSDLANYEFELPSLEKQRKLAKILWAAEETKQAYKKLLQKTDDMVKAKFEEMFGNLKRDSLGNYIIQIRGVSYQPKDLSSQLTPKHIALLRANNINNASINFDEIQFVDRKRVSPLQIIQTNDILMSASGGSLEHVGKTALCRFSSEYTFGAFCKLIRATNKLRPEYIFAYTNTPEYRNIIKKVANGTNIKNLKNEHIENILIPIPDDKAQSSFISFYKYVKQSQKHLQDSLDSLNNMMRALINQSFN